MNPGQPIRTDNTQRLPIQTTCNSGRKKRREEQTLNKASGVRSFELSESSEQTTNRLDILQTVITDGLRRIERAGMGGGWRREWPREGIQGRAQPIIQAVSNQKDDL